MGAQFDKLRRIGAWLDEDENENENEKDAFESIVVGFLLATAGGFFGFGNAEAHGLIGRQHGGFRYFRAASAAGKPDDGVESLRIGHVGVGKILLGRFFHPFRGGFVLWLTA